MPDGDDQKRSALKAEMKQARDALYRERVLDAAETIFARDGFESARIKAIAAEAGVSVGTVYGQFEGKESIFSAVHERRRGEIFEGVADLLPEATPSPDNVLSILLSGVELTVRFFVERPQYLRMHLRDATAWSAPAQATTPQAEAWVQGLELLENVLEAGAASGVLRAGPASLYARMLMAMHQVALSEWLRREGEVAVEDVVSELQGLIERAVGA